MKKVLGFCCFLMIFPRIFSLFRESYRRKNAWYNFRHDFSLFTLGRPTNQIRISIITYTRTKILNKHTFTRNNIREFSDDQTEHESIREKTETRLDNLGRYSSS